ncbi:MAG: MATE family efflux transporter [Candidatus Choladocola sp.]|nr:MATE family efflux transporter [Candidatus Choladocola sp.]
MIKKEEPAAGKTARTDELGSAPVGRLMLRLSAPAIVAQIINLLYNMVDRIYIGHIPEAGQLALTGVGVCLPLIMIISAFAALAGMGSAPRASIFLGKGQKEKAEQTLGNSVTLLFLIAVILTAVFLLFSEDLLLMFGASENTIDYAVSYMRIYACGTLFVQFTLGLNVFITAQGFAKTSMLTVLIGAVTNIVLDPILIFGLHMGVAGAALATIISQCISMIWILRFLTGKKTVLRIRKENLRLSPEIILPSVALGLSPFIMQATESLISVCFNSSLLKYGGDVAVATMTIATSVMQFSLLPLQGLSQGAQPIISFNFGAKNPDRVKSAFRILLISCVAYSMTLWAVVMVAPQLFIRVFNNSPELLEFGVPALRTYVAAAGIFGAQIACQQTFIALGNAKSSLFLALLRKIILLIPLIYLMPVLFPADRTRAVFMAEPVADIIAVTTTVCMFAVQFGKAMKALQAERR